MSNQQKSAEFAPSKRLIKALGELRSIGGQALQMPSPKRMSLDDVRVLHQEMLGDIYPLVEKACRAGCGSHQFFRQSANRSEFMALLEKFGIPTVTSIYMIQRHYLTHSPTLTVNPALAKLLEDTGINKGIPAKFLAAPFPACYFEFEPAEQRLSSTRKIYSAGYPAICEGAYIQESFLDDTRSLSKMAREILELDPNARTRCIEIGLSASPVGNELAARTGLPVAFDNLDLMVIYIQDEDEDVYSLMERHFELYRTLSELSATKETAEAFTATFRENFAFLMKVLFYVSVERKLQKAENSETELLKRIQGAGKKKDKLQKQLLRVYDKIIIGPDSYTPIAELLETSGGHGKKKPHFRRSHFGIRWKGVGEHKKPELVRVSHSIINEHLLKGGAPGHPSDYEIR